MIEAKTSGLMLALILMLAACGVRDPPVALLEAGAAGDDSSGAGAPSAGAAGGLGGANGAGGTNGGAGIPTCGDDAWGSFIVAACLSPRVPATILGDDRGVISNLTVLESVVGDLGACEDAMKIGYLEDPAAEAWAAFRLRGEDGQIWLAQFAMGFVPDDLLRPGETVDIGYFHAPTQSVSYLALERGGAPAIFVASGASWGVRVEPGPPLCQSVLGCPILEMTRVTVDGETRDLEPEEKAEIGGMVIQNDWYEDRSGGCSTDPSHVVWQAFLVGGFAAP